MKYHIDKLNRDVELDDELVAIYKQYRTLSDDIFTVHFHLNFGGYPTELNDEDLSAFCNKVLVEDLEDACENAVVSSFVASHMEEIKKLLSNGPAEVNTNVQ